MNYELEMDPQKHQKLPDILKLLNFKYFRLCVKYNSSAWKWHYVNGMCRSSRNL